MFYKYRYTSRCRCFSCPEQSELIWNYLHLPNVLKRTNQNKRLNIRETEKINWSTYQNYFPVYFYFFQSRKYQTFLVWTMISLQNSYYPFHQKLEVVESSSGKALLSSEQARLRQQLSWQMKQSFEVVISYWSFYLGRGYIVLVKTMHCKFKKSALFS